MTDLTIAIIENIKAIPYGKVATYGQIARLSGNPRAARQVARTLHSHTEKHSLPWYRVINSQGCLSLKGESGDLQRALLIEEGVEVSEEGRIRLSLYQWGVE